MKKLLFTTMAIFTIGTSYALPLGNPAEASLLCDGFFCKGSCETTLRDLWCDPCISWCDVFSLRFGFYGDYVFNRNMELQNFGGADIDTTEIYTNAGYLALNAFNQIDIFTTLGASCFSINSNGSVFNTSVANLGRYQMVSETTFSWSVGGRATLVEWGCLLMGVEGQYFAFSPSIDRVSFSTTRTAYPDDTVSVRYSEWQAGIGLAYRAHLFVPYIGLTWSRAKLNTDNDIVMFNIAPDDPEIRELENKKLWGYAVGFTLVGCDKASVTAEARFADEKALYVNGQFRF